jgi:hypothetical protein
VFSAAVHPKTKADTTRWAAPSAASSKKTRRCA